jgi:transketolase
MNEVKMAATRDAYGKVLAEIGQEYPNVVVLDADLSTWGWPNRI